MSNALADSLLERLRQAFPADQAYSPTDWDEETMPSTVQHYLEKLLRHHSRREARRLRRARTDWVDYDHPEVEETVRAFFTTVEEHMQVPQDQWTGTLRQAVRHTTIYLVRPVPTLVDFVFDGRSEALPLPQLRRRMAFFNPYAYLRKAVQAYTDKHDVDALAPDQFERVLRRVDERITADFDANQWLRLLAPLFDLARAATNQEAVPLSLLHTFFEEKNGSQIAHHLTTYEQEHAGETVDRRTLRRLIEEAEAQEASPPSVVSDASIESAAADIPVEEDLRGVADSAQSSAREPSTEESRDGGTPLWQRFQGGRTRREVESERTNSEHSEQPLWAQFRYDRPSRAAATDPTGSSEETPSSTTGDSDPAPADPESGPTALEREVLGTSASSHRPVYVRELFQGDEDAYHEVLERLSTAGSWSEASEIIASDVFRKYSVNIYSDVAVHFTDAVETQFRE